MPVKYKARDGKIYAHTPDGEFQVWSALTTSGRDLEAFERALNVARKQREAKDRS